MRRFTVASDVATRSGRRRRRRRCATALGSPPSASSVDHALARRVACADDDQADAHVERAQHLVVGDVAALAAAAGRAAAPSTRRRSIAAPQPVRQDARQVVGDAAAGDVRHALDEPARRAAAASTAGTSDAARAAPRRRSRRARARSVSSVQPSDVEHDRAARASSRWCAARTTAGRSARRRARCAGRRSRVARSTTPTMKPARSYSPSA